MSKLIKYGFVVILLCSLSPGLWAEQPKAPTGAAPVLRISTGEWDPYMSENLKHYGVTNRIITEAFALMNVKVEYGFFPWARAMEFIHSGEWDASSAWFYTTERAQNFLYSDPVIENKQVFFHLKRFDFDWKTFADLKGIPIGATIGYTYGEEFDLAEKQGQLLVERIPTDELNFRKLVLGHIKLFPIDIEVGYKILQKSFKPEEAQLISHHPKPSIAQPLHLLFSKKVERNQKMQALFNEGLKQLRQIGKYQQYLEESRQGMYIK